MTSDRHSPLSSRFRRWFGEADKSESERDNVPEALIPFLDVVQKWGALTSDSERYELAERAAKDPRELKELEEFLRAWTPEIGKVYSQWGKELSLSQNKTLARFYFTFMLIDELGIKLPPDENADHVGELIEQLQEGSQWAAGQLANYGDEARRAVPHLEAAVAATKPALRIWAHYTLARIVGDIDKHRAAIRTIGEDDPDSRSDADRALDWLTRTEEQHTINALGDFARSNKVRELRRLVTITDVDGVDSHGHRALGAAIGEKQKEAVQILLEHGADPNLKWDGERTYLHRAAISRDNGEIISLLIQHGADVNALNEDGQTPLDCAIENGCKSNVKLLRSLGGKRS